MYRWMVPAAVGAAVIVTMPVAVDSPDRLSHRQAPDFVREVVGEERLEHARQLGAFTEGLIGLRLTTDGHRNIGRRLAIGSHHADQQRPQIDCRQACHRRIDFDPIQRHLDRSGNIRERNWHGHVSLLCSHAKRRAADQGFPFVRALPCQRSASLRLCSSE